MQDRTDIWLNAAECAGRLGLTVRALRVYERHGLIAPRRTAKNWRLYGAGEIARLNEVLALKRLGLSLSRITELLAGRAVDLNRTLLMQRATLEAQRDRAERSLAIVSALQTKCAAGELVSLDELIQLATETNMTDQMSDAAWRRYEQARPRVEAKIDAALYASYAGHYQLNDGPAVSIEHRDGRLFMRVTGQPEVEAFPESDHVFFLKVVPAQISFTRADDGRVDGLIIHQNGHDHAGRRVDAATATDAEKELENRIRNKIPAPDSEKRLRRLIDDYRRDEPDYDAMTPALAAAAREQAPFVRDLLQRVGEFRALAFKGVSQDGWDVYDARFANGDTEWRFTLAPDGRFSGLLMRPTP